MHVGNGVCVVRNEAEQRGESRLRHLVFIFVGERALKIIPSEQESSSYGKKRE